ncbi:PAS domain-containing protein [Endozoicomonas sp. G2_1]|uniref:methyl-accepting chemotaxis protein n=1 Tax=Endozoicomonas sp. G2_1 TaxID=2821091 RepID=UPI001ADBA851|nr:methyl-accepting chemotaxis protein [Endozoicomonas sp. G2_1]MBO9490576.1 PAS domain-containing protein [Endozoicomonas sp. G2_1]
MSKKRIQQSLSDWLNQLESDSNLNIPQELAFISPQLQKVAEQIDQLKTKLAASEEDSNRLHHYSTSAGVGLWDLTLVNGDPSHPDNKNYYTQKFRHQLGYQNEQDFPNTAEAWFNTLHPEDVEGIFTAFGNHLNDKSGRTPYNHDFRMKTKQGQYRWFKVQGESIRNASGVAEFSSGSVSDIHDSKLIELAKQEDDLKRQQLIENVADVVQNVSLGMNSSCDGLAHTNQQMIDTLDSIERGNQAVNQMSSLINQVSNKNNEIIGIVDRIQTIAEQTNLLALNAAIESARAGEQGRGFAVVADEVRQLAHNSAQSSKEITELVTGVAADSQESVEISTDVLNNMQAISEAVNSLKTAITSSSDDISDNRNQVERINDLMAAL